MCWIRYVKIALVNTIGALVAIIWVPVPQAVAQPSLLEQANSAVSPLETLESINNNLKTTRKVNSLSELYQLRDEIKAELNKVSQRPTLQEVEEPWQYQFHLQQYEKTLKNFRNVEANIIREEKALQSWKQAIAKASKAVEKGKTIQANYQTWQEAENLWLEAIFNLRQIPQNSLITDKAIEKMIEYQGYLAVASYEKVIAARRWVENTEDDTDNNTTNYSPIAYSLSPGFTIYGDTNRDGELDEADRSSREKWTLSEGALMLFNSDDDNGDRIPDWRDREVNGKTDEADLALVNIQVAENYQDAQIYISTDTDASDYINVFQKTEYGWQPVDISGTEALISREKVVLGVEAKQFADRNWKGVVKLTAIAEKNGRQIASDSIQIGVVPWLMSPNTAPVKELHVSERGFGNQEFVAKIKQIVERTGAKAQINSGGTTWMQDTKEIGYVQFPSQGKTHNMNVVLKANRPGENDQYARSLLKEDFGWFEVGKPRQLDPLNRWADAYGNLEVTPPLPGYDLGRIYYGKAGEVGLNPEIVDFIKAQKIQGPPVDIDTSWLMIRHVDEIISFIPSKFGKPLMLIVSPEAGVKLLEELSLQGYGQAAINRGLSTQTTVRAALKNQKLIQHNLYLQREKLDPLIDKLKREFNLSDDQIIQVPAMFGYSGYSWWPNMVNSVVVNGELLVSNPLGALINGRDYTQEKFRRLVADASLNINFMDDKYYQNLRGSIHDATNTTRLGKNNPFWKSLSEDIISGSRE
ncbi:protein-arginine deiminase [Okeania hirsuta]|uniref:Protein-arginine deiminase n=3 Tax=Okeania TaxID=1458928 RepID=A0A3N6QPH8_9CYAN|nr:MULTISPECIES: protein-arginine deiminase domain-containing protein [Okeania]NET74931.1 protein-arginine deiminase [Okeania sp. SIO1F9]RQH48272.1 protein-arginine deiminase [Okeania hirsuta]